MFGFVSGEYNSIFVANSYRGLVKSWIAEVQQSLLYVTHLSVIVILRNACLLALVEETFTISEFQCLDLFCNLVSFIEFEAFLFVYLFECSFTYEMEFCDC